MTGVTLPASTSVFRTARSSFFGCDKNPRCRFRTNGDNMSATASDALAEDGKGDARHLLKRLAIGRKARGSPHALNRHHEEVSQSGGLVRARQLAARLGAAKRLDEDRLHAGLIVAQEVGDGSVAGVPLQVGAE